MAAQLGAESTRTKRATANYATDTYSPHVMTGVVDKAHAAGYLGAGQLVSFSNAICGLCSPLLYFMERLSQICALDTGQFAQALIPSMRRKD